MLTVILLKVLDSPTLPGLFGSERLVPIPVSIPTRLIGKIDPFRLVNRRFRKEKAHRYAKNECVHTDAVASVVLNGKKGLAMAAPVNGGLWVEESSSGTLFVSTDSNSSYVFSGYDVTLRTRFAETYHHMSRRVRPDLTIIEEMGWEERTVECTQAAWCMFNERERYERIHFCAYGYRIYRVLDEIYVQLGEAVNFSYKKQDRTMAHIAGKYIYAYLKNEETYNNLYDRPVFSPNTGQLWLAEISDEDYTLTEDGLRLLDSDGNLKEEYLTAMGDYLKSVKPPFFELQHNDVFYDIIERMQPPQTNWGEYVIGLKDLPDTISSLIRSIRIK